MNNSLYAVPLGGLGEIGLNMMTYRYADRILIVDAGIMFPDELDFGVDIVIPDFEYLRENKENIAGLVITHGHEDHIGAIPYLLKEFLVPVYGTKLTLGLIENKLREHALDEAVEMVCIAPGEKVLLEDFEIEPVRVNHSIADAVSLAITTPAGTIIHTGDFKVDYTPIDDNPIELNKFAEFGQAGVLALFSDSTNVDQEGHTISERDVGKTLDEIFRITSGKIIVASFSSNIHRIQQVVDASEKYGRKICLVGRSIVENTAIAAELGYLNINPGSLVDVKKLADLPSHKITVLSTGSQGEPMSALSRIAVNEHKQIKVKKGDAVLISAKIIPGNERSIHRLINHFSQLGANIVYEKISEIHVSGHAYREELKLMLHLVKPRHFVPVHGEYRHLSGHTKLACEMGIGRESACLAQNGDVIKIDGQGIEIVDKVYTGRVFVDGKGVGDVGRVVIRDRRHLANDGIVMVIIGLNHRSGEIVYGPELVTRGFVYEDNSQDLLEEAREMLVSLLEESSVELKANEADIKKTIKSALKKWFYQRIARYPMILSTIVEF
ncbi:MAG: ribonuclease J [bacterium]